MQKVFLLTLGLLALTPTVAGQERIPRRPVPSPVGQPLSPATPTWSKEELERLLPVLRRFLEKERASAQGTIGMSNQNPLTPFATMSPLGGLLDVTQDANLRKYGPLGPNVKYGPMGPLGEGQDPQQSSNVGSNPAVVWNLDGFKHPLNGVNIDLSEVKRSLEGFDLSLSGFQERVEASTNGAIYALNQLQEQLITASNEPSVLRPTGRVLQPPPSASAASAPDIRRLDRNSLPESGRLIVRSNPKGYYVGSLDVNHNDQFKVKAVKNDEKGCWALGDTLGTVKLHDVWVNCNGLKGEFGNVRPATDSEIPDPGYQSARHLEGTFASLIAPVTNADKKGPKDAKEFAVLRRDTTLYGNYPLSQSPTLSGGKPWQGSDELGVVHVGQCNEFFKVRYFSNDGKAAVGKYIHVNSKTGDKVEKWGIIPMSNIVLPLSEGPPPCNQ